MKADELLEYIKIPKWDRVFRIKDALMAGASVKRICESTKIDRWFIYQIQKICDCEKEIAQYDLKSLPDELLTKAKLLGFSDEQIVRIMREENAEMIYERRKSMGLTRLYKMVDTCAAEFEAKTPYFYSSFEPKAIAGPAAMMTSNESKISEKKKSLYWAVGPIGLVRVLNLIIVVCMDYWLLKNVVTKPSWLTAIQKL
jgi:carbamoyl-phosphate synthase large subunit